MFGCFKIILFISVFYFQNAFSQKVFNVSDYGAVGDGKKDETGAFQECFNMASNYLGDVVVYIPKGIYVILKPVKYNIKGLQSLQIKGDASQRPILKMLKPISIFWIEGNKNKPQAKLFIESLVFEGNNSPYSSKHLYFNTYMKGSAANIFNLATVTIQNTLVQNIYGDGFLIKNLNYTECPIKNRTKILIRNNEILNVWGQKNANSKGSLWGYYGDGITLNNVANSEITGNKISNNISVTHQYGRAGIVAEFNCENILFQNNIIGGYESGIHCEADFGGHVIKNNIFKASEIGVFVFASITKIKRDFPLIIENNYFSNNDLPKDMNISRLRAKGERGFISIITRGDFREYSKIIDNKFIADNEYQFQSNRLLFINSKNVILENNQYRNMNFSQKEKLPQIDIMKGYDIRRGEKYFNLNNTNE